MPAPPQRTNQLFFVGRGGRWGNYPIPLSMGNRDASFVTFDELFTRAVGALPFGGEVHILEATHSGLLFSANSRHASFMCY